MATPDSPNIRALLDRVLYREGWPKYTNRRADRGGPTKGGITLTTLRTYRRDPALTEYELIGLTDVEARLIYFEQYVQPWAFVLDPVLLEVLVDYAVTSWHDDPTKAVQQALGVPIDGVLGPVTRGAVAQADTRKLAQAVVGYRVRHMVNLALNDPKLLRLIDGYNDLQLLNLRGWINRATSFLG